VPNRVVYVCIVNPLTPAAERLLYAYPESESECRAAWRDRHITAYRHDYETQCFVDHQQSLVTKKECIDRVACLVPASSERVIPYLVRKAGWVATQYPQAFIRDSLRAEARSRRPATRPVVCNPRLVQDLIAGIDPEASADTLLEALGGRRAAAPRRISPRPATAMVPIPLRLAPTPSVADSLLTLARRTAPAARDGASSLTGTTAHLFQYAQPSKPLPAAPPAPLLLNEDSMMTDDS
jgi:hypothetical protein